MNKILVPTDFSDNATRALQYAVLLAQQANAEITLLHIYDIYIPADGTPLMPYALEAMSEQTKAKLKACAEEYIPSEIKYHIAGVLGDAVHTIATMADEKKADLVVMGIRGCNKLEQIVIGSTTTALIRNTKTPVMVVPETAALQLPKTILFSFDGKEIPAKATMRPLTTFAEILQAKIQVLNVISDLEASIVDKRYIARQAFHALGDADYSVHFEENGDVMQGIANFIESNTVDAIAMIYHPRGFFNRLFAESRAHKMAFYTQKPLLILPELED